MIDASRAARQLNTKAILLVTRVRYQSENRRLRKLGTCNLVTFLTSLLLFSQSRTSLTLSVRATTATAITARNHKRWISLATDLEIAARFHSSLGPSIEMLSGLIYDDLFVTSPTHRKFLMEYQISI